MPQDKLISFLKVARQHQIGILVLLGFLVVVLLGIVIWFQPEVSTAPPSLEETTAVTDVPTPATPSSESTPPTSPPTSALTQELRDRNTKLYQVKPGDSLWSVAEAELGSGELYRQLAQANGLSTSSWLDIGQELQLPTSQPETSLSGEQTTKRDAILYGAESYTVQPGDSLWRIAAEKLGDPYRWTELYAENKGAIGASPDLIFPGTELVIPAHSADTAPSQ